MSKQIRREQQRTPMSWLWKWVINNQFVSVLVIILLVLLNIAVFSQIAHIFAPIGEFVGIVGFPIVFAGVLFYMLKPGLDFLVKHNVNKQLAVWIMLIVATVVLLALMFSVIPIIQRQVIEFVRQWPTYYQVLYTQVNKVLESDIFAQVQIQFSQVNTNVLQSITSRLNELLNFTVSGLGNVVGALGEFVLGIITMPVLLYYLLLDGDKLLGLISKVFPTKSRAALTEVLYDMNTQISQYIRGQITVAIAVGLMFLIGYSIIGLPYGASIAFFAGALNVIPYVGSFFGMIPALIIALVHSPMMFLQVIIVFMIEQTIEGRIISPLVLGNTMKIHPATILLILLTAGKLFGVTGLLLGIPGYAILKVIFIHVFRWYRTYSGLYGSDEAGEAIRSTAPSVEEIVVKQEKVD